MGQGQRADGKARALHEGGHCVSAPRQGSGHGGSYGVVLASTLRPRYRTPAPTRWGPQTLCTSTEQHHLSGTARTYLAELPSFQRWHLTFTCLSTGGLASWFSLTMSTGS